MKSSRLPRVLSITLLFTGAAAILLWKLIPPARLDQLPNSGRELDELAAYRYDHERGMTPCQSEDREITNRARIALRGAGIPDPALIAVVAPTFEGPKIIAFADHEFSVLTYRDKSGYTPPESWFMTQEARKLRTQVSPSDQYRVVAPLIRQARYASTVSRSGHDGTMYFLDWGGECALTWSPNENDGPSAYVAMILDETSSAKPSIPKLVGIASEMVKQEQRTGR